MSDTLSCAELDGQRVELLPARTVLSMFTQAANGSDAFGGIGLGIPILSYFFPGSGNAVGGAGQSANGS
ncbi:MAG TPA: hypothetical protein VGP04_02615 [Pseudonocardiaceae bacterium]|jgi:hypothetical protein|nr:hypothetical protein [Pseudonocardiaceae bacterium]